MAAKAPLDVIIGAGNVFSSRRKYINDLTLTVGL